MIHAQQISVVNEWFPKITEMSFFLCSVSYDSSNGPMCTISIFINVEADVTEIK